MRAVLPCGAWLLTLFGACETALGVRFKANHGHRFDSLHETMNGLLKDIRSRFAIVDADGDGTVSLAEMMSGFSHEPVDAGRGVLRDMLAECTGGNREATFCTQEQMERALGEWVNSDSARTTVALFQAGGGWRRADAEEGRPCGPSAETPDKGLEGVECRMRGAECIADGSLAAWSLDNVCHRSACICEATPQTKRLAKLGLSGAAGVTTASNFSDPGDKLRMPDCGDGWTGFKVVGRIEDLRMSTTANEWARLERQLKEKFMFLTPKIMSEALEDARRADTEVALYKSARHRLTKHGEYGKVCMMSWQATRSTGDWMTNFMTGAVPFQYVKPGMSMTAPKGIVIAYESIRNKIKSLFDRECCNADFQADKIIISGHSHGGAMAELHAIDVVSEWECPRGRDLGARELAVVLAAPHRNMFVDNDISKVWSCNDAKTCLAGSVVTIVTHGDFVGDGRHRMKSHELARHSSKVAWLPCPSVPKGANHDHNPGFDQSWCHGMYNYIPLVEKKLVGEAGWGSSCDGFCGDPNRMIQCNQAVLIWRTGCSYAKQEWLKPPTECPASKWLPQEEQCNCHFDLCTDLTRKGCSA